MEIEIPLEFEAKSELSSKLRQEIIDNLVDENESIEDYVEFSSNSNSSTEESDNQIIKKSIEESSSLTEEDNDQIIKLNENEVITFLEANKRWEEYETFKKEMCEDKDVIVESSYGTSIVLFEGEQLYTMDNTLIGILLERDNCWQWDWAVDLNRSAEDEEKILKVRTIVEKEYNLTLDKFWTTKQLLIKYIVATSTVELGFDTIYMMPVHDVKFVIGQRVR